MINSQHESEKPQSAGGGRGGGEGGGGGGGRRGKYIFLTRSSQTHKKTITFEEI